MMEWTTRLFLFCWAMDTLLAMIFRQWFLVGAMISIGLVVLLWEYICFQMTGMLISDKFEKQSRFAKIVLIAGLIAFALFLGVHFAR